MGRTQYEDRDKLTAREMDVLRLAAAGETIHQTGKILWIEEQTVKFHRTAIIRKLQASNITHAVALAYASGLLESHEKVSVIYELLDQIVAQLRGREVLVG